MNEFVLKTKNLYCSYPKNIFYQNSEYELHQAGLKDFRSQNSRIVAFEGEAAGVTQFCGTTARDRCK
jgi:hypothetical protein